MHRTRWLAVPLAALSLAACGSSGSSDKLSKSELVAKADKICQDLENKIKALPKPKSLSEIQKFGEETRSAAEDGVSKLKNLTPPDSVKSDYESFVKIGENAVAQAGKLADAGKEKDKGKVQAALKEAVKNGKESRRLAQKIGFKKCGSGGA